MKGAVFLGDRTVDLREFPEPMAGPGEVVIAVRASGMCGSDLHYYRDEPGRENTSGRCIAGHEPAGVVHEVGPDVENFAVGDRVMVHHYGGCGRCDGCRSGWTQMCTTAPCAVYGTHEHGAHAPYMRVTAGMIVPLDDALGFAAGAAIGCGTGTAWGGLERLGAFGGSYVVVFGQGPVGLSATMLARARGARVIAVDPDPTRREQARRMGAETVLDPVEPVASAIRDLTHGRGAGFVLETSGASAAVAEGMASLAGWGRMCLVGLGGEVRFPIASYHHVQLNLMTSWALSVVQQRQCAEFVVDHGLPIYDLFTHQWSLDDVECAYAEFDRQAAGKGVFVFE